MYLLFVPFTRESTVIVAGSSLLFFVGLIDDILHIKPYQKLIGQFIGVAVIIGFGLVLPWTDSEIFNIALTAFWLIGITNAINLLDNMDGLAAGISAVAAFSLAIGFGTSGQTAELVFGAKTPAELKIARRNAKITNFAIAYAVEAFGLSQRVGISRNEAKKVIEDYYNTYKGVKTFMEETPKIAREQGYVSSIYGRRRYVPSIKDRNYNVRLRAEREAINMPIQGTASDIVKIAMLKVDAALKRENLKTRIIMQVHDELLLEAPAEEVERAKEIVKKEMEAAVELDVPLIVEVGSGENWMTAK